MKYMSILRNYLFRNFVKEKVSQLRDTFAYSTNHPYTILNKMARDSTVEFILQTCPRSVACRTPKRLMDLALSKVSIDGLYLEFGVSAGASLTYIAQKNPDKRIHGFDSFLGLPDAWLHNPEGTFSTGGKPPKMPDNVRLWQGYFQDSLPEWCRHHCDVVAFLHIDCDLRASTETVLCELAAQIVPGTVMLFDDYFNFPAWQEDGHAVLTAFLQEHNRRAEYIGYAYKELALIVR